MIFFYHSGEDETAWKPYYGKAKSFKDISKDCKEWSEKIRRTLHDIKVKKGETDPKAKHKQVPTELQVILVPYHRWRYECTSIWVLRY